MIFTEVKAVLASEILSVLKEDIVSFVSKSGIEVRYQLDEKQQHLICGSWENLVSIHKALIKCIQANAGRREDSRHPCHENLSPTIKNEEKAADLGDPSAIHIKEETLDSQEEAEAQSQDFSVQTDDKCQAHSFQIKGSQDKDILFPEISCKTIDEDNRKKWSPTTSFTRTDTFKRAQKAKKPYGHHETRTPYPLPMQHRGSQAGFHENDLREWQEIRELLDFCELYDMYSRFEPHFNLI